MKVYKDDPEYCGTVVGGAKELKDYLEHWKLVEHKERLEAACNEAYQVLGITLLTANGGIPKYTNEDVKRILDNLLAAVNNRPLPHSDILQWKK